MLSIKSSLFIVLLTVTIGYAHAQKVTYLGNEGILVEYQGKKVIVDALFDDPTGKFHTPDYDLMEKIVMGKAPYDKINANLITHAHGDHFDAVNNVSFLRENKSAKMIATPQAVDSMKLKSQFYDEVSDRIATYPWTKGWKTTMIDDITIASAYTRHAGRAYGKVQNQIFLITIGNKKVLHVADTQMDVRYFDDLRLVYEEVDLAIVPFWFLTNLFGTEIVEKHIGAKKVVGMHLPMGHDEKTEDKVHEAFPSAILFTDPGQEITF
ncbi:MULTISPECIES: MBL fold metallo-hydrolase [Reichenbachiella]|uniref:L-ascorbate metabolism protein UlaG, beta-lactamase superfamily n=1 Tax=Reichenbachiella agariperforans TaxID=156994 RepID=A0A1M6L9U5_REIAG|nr:MULTISPECIES: MBL fold metallo-hydrolase [Reichenbachiella]SHJ67981.1 L-ascorbate metabolism protein UlaG, beta-lactamase superfamily [Reichenbachiella agariperforans]